MFVVTYSCYYDEGGGEEGGYYGEDNEQGNRHQDGESACGSEMTRRIVTVMFHLIINNNECNSLVMECDLFSSPYLSYFWFTIMYWDCNEW